MSTTRRGFIGVMGAGFAALATGCAGRQLTDGGAEIPAVKETPSTDVVNIERPKRFDLRQERQERQARLATPQRCNKGNILRLSQITSSWVRDHKVMGGNFFRHTWLASDCEDLGNVLECTGYCCVGAKAVRFNNFELGVAPAEVYTDPESDAFEAIVRAADSPDHSLSCGSMYGPVYMFMLVDGRQLEMFCGTKSMRYFAADLGPYPYDGPCHLVSKKMSTKSFSWYVPVVIKA